MFTPGLWLQFSWQWQLIIAIIISLLIRWSIVTVTNICRLPPGPWGLPVVGYAPWIGEHSHKSFVELGKKYGGLFSVRLGHQTYVILNDWPAIKATLVDQSKIFSGRPHLTLLQDTPAQTDFAFRDGIIWKKQRNLTVQCLRKIGMGRRATDDVVMDMIQGWITQLSQLGNKAVDIESMLFLGILSTNWRLISNRDIPKRDKQSMSFEECSDHIFYGIRNSNPLHVFPWLRFVPPNGLGYKQFHHSSQQLTEYLKKVIDDHLKAWKEGSERDFIDYYITEMKKNNSEPPYNVEHLLGSTYDLFLGGVETIKAVALSGVFLLAYYPDVQHRVQEELDSVVGRGRLPCLDDFSRLHYLEAFIMEVHRFYGGPLSLPHTPNQTANVLGYTIPKGTVCLQNIYAVHHDPGLWDEPEQFRPERFLDDNNRVINGPKYFMPFSIGPRLCIGQAIAETHLRMIFGCLAHTFNLSFPPDLPRPSLEPLCGASLRPHPYSLLIKKRNDC